ncbi:MAG: carboxylating nicotinate-nucleotide diphosphorylase [Alphaproteobacteria bacterium]|nr:carboxylating nicotinate-nucleotide diphosphorylase [Alphaproteobacteria bacterium]MDX5367892.1 carboxylating nicotinate-nucleotide diphosphorylase [Alphaproteobacteria bacterium]MDX5462760.1 carboxylating nicotinate-nucleotide diphosphorylase [Alphaproteobacteria bacterium]
MTTRAGTAVPNLPAVMIEPLVRAALLEDLGHTGDITTDLTVPADARGAAVMATRADGVLAGLDLAETAFRLIDPALALTRLAADGDRIAKGREVLRVEGSARGLLTAERVALNFVCHLSGVATATRAMVDAIEGTGARITCTRKTTPGLRSVEKHAVRLGGGANHRHGLDDAVLIKDNHIALAGGIGPAVARARAGLGHLVKVEVECDTPAQVEEALAAAADVIMLDNMDVDTLRACVKTIAGRAIVEASGNVRLDTVRAIAETGVDYISSGALTHSVRALDLGLDIAV